MRDTPHAPSRTRCFTSWAEKKIARERAAIALLHSKGFSVSRSDGNSPIARYWVSSYRGEFSGDDVLALAVSQGLAL